MFTLAISSCQWTQCSLLDHIQFTLINEPNFQVPMQYCSLEHQTLLTQPDKPTTDCHFPLAQLLHFFLKLLVIVLHSSPVAYWTPSNLWGLPSGVISFCLFILFMGFSQQEYWRVLGTCPVGSRVSEVWRHWRLKFRFIDLEMYIEIRKQLRK